VTEKVEDIVRDATSVCRRHMPVTYTIVTNRDTILPLKPTSVSADGSSASMMCLR
jgi:hypothetical protein